MRAFAIADRLVHRFQVVVLNGGNPPVGLAVPTSVSLVQLPPQSNIALRGEIILAQYTEIKPQVLFIDTFPFGNEILADELLPTVERARDSVSLQPLVVCSVTDLLYGERRRDEEKDDRITAVLDKYFDVVIVHSDPDFARLGEFLQPRDALTIPVYHSGFVARERDEPPSDSERDERVLVAPGSGINGGRMLRAAGHTPTVIDYSAKQLAMLSKFNVRAYFGDATRPDLLHSAGISEAMACSRRIESTGIRTS